MKSILKHYPLMQNIIWSWIISFLFHFSIQYTYSLVHRPWFKLKVRKLKQVQKNVYREIFFGLTIIYSRRNTFEVGFLSGQQSQISTKQAIKQHVAKYKHISSLIQSTITVFFGFLFVCYILSKLWFSL